MTSEKSEFEARMESIITDTIAQLPNVRALMYIKHPLTKAMTERTQKAVSQALKQAIEDPGVLVRIGCDVPSECLLACDLLGGVCPKLKPEYTLVPDKSTKAHFELANGSAIYVALNEKGK